MTEKDPLLEALAELEHKQWAKWSMHLAKTEKLSKERLARWKKLWVPYNQLPEEIKEQDRAWATIVLLRIRKRDAKLARLLKTVFNEWPELPIALRKKFKAWWLATFPPEKDGRPVDWELGWICLRSEFVAFLMGMKKTEVK